MTVLEKKKYRLIQSIMTADAQKITEIEKIFKKKSSFMCSAKELRESVRQQLIDLKAGKIDFIPHEHLKEKVLV